MELESELEDTWNLKDREVLDKDCGLLGIGRLRENSHFFSFP